MDSLFSSNWTKNICKILPKSDPQHFPSQFYGFLIAAAVIELLSCPFTVLLNALVMVGVKTKRRLQTHLNILLASLALTDLMVGLVVQPLHVTVAILLLQGKRTDEVCEITSAFLICFLSFGATSLLHLALISGERYLAIKYPFIHSTFVTKRRLIVASILGWLVIPLRLVLTYIPGAAIILQGTIVASIILLQVLVYREARRHEKQILAQQVSLEARARFRKEKKALKLTTIIILAIGLCYFPPFVFLLTLRRYIGGQPSDIETAVLQVAILPIVLNSLLNPVIYTVRKKHFRIAFVELLLMKVFQGAKEFERRLFGSPNVVEPVTLETGR
ncbi:octopamine receptor beta-1R-like [Oculina patagonica]